MQPIFTAVDLFQHRVGQCIRGAVENDPTATRRVRDALTSRFGGDRVVQSAPLSASEDFGSYGTGWKTPSVFWTIGGTDPDIYRNAEQAGTLNELPTNHNPRFAPILHPTLETGIEALVAAACAWLEPTTN